MYVVFLIAALALTGCAQTVEIRHALQHSSRSAATPVKVQLQIPPPSLRQSTAESGLVAVGMLNDWNIDVYTHLPGAMERVVSGTFKELDISDSYRFDCPDCGLFLRPEVTELRVNKLTMQAFLSVGITFYDARGKRVAWVEGSGHSSAVSLDRVGAGVAGYFVPFFGSIIGESVVRTTVEAAFNRALSDLAEKLQTEANRGALARTWLPAELMDKQEFGKQEYAAERVALDNGCDLGKDGLRLVEQSYFTEKYEAHCWAQPVFRITCEYGRCEADPASQSRVATTVLPGGGSVDAKERPVLP